MIFYPQTLLVSNQTGKRNHGKKNLWQIQTCYIDLNPCIYRAFSNYINLFCSNRIYRVLFWCTIWKSMQVKFYNLSHSFLYLLTFLVCWAIFMEIFRHVEHWNVPKMTLLKQILKPSRGLWRKRTDAWGIWWWTL